MAAQLAFFKCGNMAKRAVSSISVLKLCLSFSASARWAAGRAMISSWWRFTCGKLAKASGPSPRQRLPSRSLPIGARGSDSIAIDRARHGVEKASVRVFLTQKFRAPPAIALAATGALAAHIKLAMSATKNAVRRFESIIVISEADGNRTRNHRRDKPVL